MSMNGFYQGKASILRQTDTEVSNIGEVTPIFTEVGKAGIRITSSTSQYVRTEAGWKQENKWNGLVKAKTDVKQGDHILWKGETYLVDGADDDGAGVFLKLTLDKVE